jgi:hypothetical protein
MKDGQKKACLFCVLAFLAGLLVATSGCANRQHVIGIQSPVEGVYTVLQPPIITMGKIEKVYQVK